MKQLSNVRKASKAAGDDITLTRWIVTGRQEHRPSAPMPASATGTRFPKRILHPDQMTGILVSGHSNVKIGRDVRKGPLRGYWIYTLSLEERATCPTSCGHWRDCYGNAMPFAKRVRHGAEMLRRLEVEIAALCKKRAGILIRLHALGDFYSPRYVTFWDSMLALHPNLSIFGYTAHAPDSEIGGEVARVSKRRGFGRFAVRFSGYDGERAAVTVAESEPVPLGTIMCPQQTGATAVCATCALCFDDNHLSIGFRSH